MTIEIVDLPTKNGDFPADDIDVLIWVWVNTYNTIFSGMNIHFNPAMTWGELQRYYWF